MSSPPIGMHDTSATRPGGLRKTTVDRLLDRAISLWWEGKVAESLEDFASASHDPWFARHIFELLQSGGLDAPLLLRVSAAFRAKGSVKEADDVRRAAAYSAIHAGLHAIRSGDEERCLQLFAQADVAIPLDSLNLKTKMTVLRDMVVAHGRRGNMVHGLSALERLFRLCHGPGVGGCGCPPDGVASAPFASFFPPGRGSDCERALELHLKLLSKLVERAFIRISWDLNTRQLRTGAREEDFVGMVNSSTGRYYSMDVGPDEDLVESWRAYAGENREIEERVKGQLAQGRYDLAAKLMLSQLRMFLNVDLQVSCSTGHLESVNLPDFVLSGSFLGYSVRRLYEQSRLVGGGAEPTEATTQDALLVTWRVIEMLSSSSIEYH